MVKIAGMNLYWYSDWNGDEVGYPEIDVVGLYHDGNGMNYYIDVYEERVLESWYDEDEDEGAGE